MNVLPKVVVDVRELVLPVCVALLRVLRLDRLARAGSNAAKTLLVPWPLWPSRDESAKPTITVKALEDEPHIEKQEGGQNPSEERYSRTLSPCTIDEKGVPTYEALQFQQHVKPKIIDEIKFPGIDVDDLPERDYVPRAAAVLNAVEKVAEQTTSRVQEMVEDLLESVLGSNLDNHETSEEHAVEDLGDDQHVLSVRAKRKESDGGRWDTPPEKRPKPEETEMSPLTLPPRRRDLETRTDNVDEGEPTAGNAPIGGLAEGHDATASTYRAEIKTPEATEAVSSADPDPEDRTRSEWEESSGLSACGRHGDAPAVASTGEGETPVSDETSKTLEETTMSEAASDTVINPVAARSVLLEASSGLAAAGGMASVSEDGIGVDNESPSESEPPGQAQLEDKSPSRRKAPPSAVSRLATALEESSGLAAAHQDSFLAPQRLAEDASVETRSVGGSDHATGLQAAPFEIPREEPADDTVHAAEQETKAKESQSKLQTQPEWEESSGLRQSMDERAPCFVREELSHSSCPLPLCEDRSEAATVARSLTRLPLEESSGLESAWRSFSHEDGSGGLGETERSDKLEETTSQRQTTASPKPSNSIEHTAETGTRSSGDVQDHSSSRLVTSKKRDHVDQDAPRSNESSKPQALLLSLQVNGGEKAYDSGDDETVKNFGDRSPATTLPFEESSGLAAAMEGSASAPKETTIPETDQRLTSSSTRLGRKQVAVASPAEGKSTETMQPAESRDEHETGISPVEPITTPSWCEAAPYEAAARLVESPSGEMAPVHADEATSSCPSRLLETPTSLALSPPFASAFSMALRGPSESAVVASPSSIDDLVMSLTKNREENAGDASPGTEPLVGEPRRTRNGSNDTEDTESDRRLEEVDSNDNDGGDEEPLVVRDDQGRDVGVLAHVVQVEEVPVMSNRPDTKTALAAPDLGVSSSDDAWSSDEDDVAFASVPPVLQKRTISAVYYTI